MSSAPKRYDLISLAQQRVPDLIAHGHKCVFFVDFARTPQKESTRRLRKLLAHNTCRVRTEKELLWSFKHAQPKSIWLSADAYALSPLATSTPTHSEHRLLLFNKIADTTRYFLSAYFRHVVVKDDVRFLPPQELAEVLTASNHANLFVAGAVDEKEQAVVLYRGTLEPLVVPLAWFRGYSNTSPKADASSLEISDFGRTVKLGAFEASAEAILFDFDAAFRKKRRKNFLKEDDSFGASLRRLRLQRNVRRSDFAGISEKTIARLERNEIDNPQSHTLRRIATRLGVNVDELASY